MNSEQNRQKNYFCLSIESAAAAAPYYFLALIYSLF